MGKKDQIFFETEKKNDDPLFALIETACEELIYVSETDAPVRAFAGDGPAAAVTAELILVQTRSPVDTPVEVISFDDFFGRLTSQKDWYGAADIEKAKRFRDLQSLLEENLRNRTVFRLGRIRIRIFVVGVDAAGRLMGVTTDAVET